MRTIKSETPTIISGKIRGARIKVRVTCLPLKSYRVVAREASVPSIVASIHDEIATIKEFFRAWWRESWYKSVSNHWKENPVNGNAIIWLLLKENIGNKRDGAYKNTK